METLKTTAGLLAMVLLVLKMSIGVAIAQEKKAEPRDPFAEDFERCQKVVNAFLPKVRAEKDPVLRFLICTKEVMEINAYLTINSHVGGFRSSMEEIPDNPDNRKKLLEAAGKNMEKMKVKNGKSALRLALLDQMRNDVSLAKPEYKKQLNDVIRALEYFPDHIDP